jgi:hypothetical protein
MALNIFKKISASIDSPIDPKKAAKRILRGDAPPNLWINGHLNLSNNPNLTSLPEGLKAVSLDLSGCVSLQSLPENLSVRRLNLTGCKALVTLPPGLSCYELVMCDTDIRELPADLRVEFRIDLSNCTKLERLPEGLKVGTLVLNGCSALEALPENLGIYFLDISGCTALRSWPREAILRIGRFRAVGCSQIRSLPHWIGTVAQLDVIGCANLSELPESLRVSSWIDLAGTGIKSLPMASRGAQLRWRGVPINERIAFHPETITAQEILQEKNAELRRVMLERMGYETFITNAEAQILDIDSDPGGERRLLRIELEGDEDLVCVSVRCPSTSRLYIIRVPPTMRTCRQAVAWIAGFDNPKDYKPLVET